MIHNIYQNEAARSFGLAGARAICLMVLFGAPFWGGCSRKITTPNGPEGRPVSGAVTYQGQAVTGAMVTFKSRAYSAVATTDEEGRFQLLAAGRGDSVPLGSYVVTVSKLEAPVVAEPTGDAQYQIPAPNAPPPAPPKNLLPAKYNTDASGLTAEVKADGENDFRFELTD